MKKNQTYNICIVGLGSIGKRHAKNIASYCKEKNITLRLDAFRSEKDGEKSENKNKKMNQENDSKNKKDLTQNKNVANKKGSDVESLSDKDIDTEIEAIIDNVYYDINDVPNDYDAVFITNPTNKHHETLEQFQRKSRGFFIEKPVFTPNDLLVEESNTNMPFNKEIYVHALVQIEDGEKKINETEFYSYRNNNLEIMLPRINDESEGYSGYANCSDIVIALTKSQAAKTYVACPLRYNKVISYIKKNVDVEEVIAIQAICSSYLPDWRPGQDYRKVYSANKNQGGGVEIDLIHEWDYITYLFGKPTFVTKMSNKISNLEINTNDIAVYTGTYNVEPTSYSKYNNLEVMMKPIRTVELHLDYFGRRTRRELKLWTNDSEIFADITNGRVTIFKDGKEKKISLEEDRNDSYKKEIAMFFDILEGKKKNTNPIKTAVDVIGIAVGIDEIKVGNKKIY